jgi:hypothetical protein
MGRITIATERWLIGANVLRLIKRKTQYEALNKRIKKKN